MTRWTMLVVGEYIDAVGVVLDESLEAANLAFDLPEERLALLVDALARLGSSMVSSRDALGRFFDRQEVRPRFVRFSSEGDELPEGEIDPRTERSDVQVSVLRVQEDLSSALNEAK